VKTLALAMALAVVVFPLHVDSKACEASEVFEILQPMIRTRQTRICWVRFVKKSILNGIFVVFAAYGGP
jgi:hypothetical protein